MAGARTVSTGSMGKMGVPSGMAQMSPVKRKFFKYSRKPSLKMPRPRR